MADIENRDLVAERMEFDFEMREIDAEGRVVRSVRMSLDGTDGITHPEITEAYQNFLSACGYIFGRGEIRYVTRDEDNF